MRASSRGVAFFAALAAVACLTDFPNPLGPVSEGFIERRLLGSWNCVQADGSDLGTMTVLDFDGKQYHVSFASEGEEPEQHRAYSSRIKEGNFWNIQSIQPKRDTNWSFLEYSFSETGRLLLRAVRPEPFEDIREDPAQVRKLLEVNLENSEFFEPAWECTPKESADGR